MNIDVERRQIDIDIDRQIDIDVDRQIGIDIY